MILRRTFFLGIVLSLFCLPLFADQVIMKDGTIYKGKIQIDTDKAILIGNPPFDPQSYLLEADQIEKIIYEEYRPNSPAERKRGLTAEAQIAGLMFSGEEISLNPAARLYLGAGFRVHPAIELNGGLDWMPAASAKDSFAVSNGTTTRRYQDFGQFGAKFSLRLYPMHEKKWKTEPYVIAGYGWNSLSAKGSGDRLKGSGWHAGLGAIRPITRHIYSEVRFAFEQTTYDTIDFLGQKSGVNPKVVLRSYGLVIGFSYRL